MKCQILFVACLLVVVAFSATAVANADSTAPVAASHFQVVHFKGYLVHPDGAPATDAIVTIKIVRVGIHNSNTLISSQQVTTPQC